MGRTINKVDRTLSITILKFSDVYNTKQYFIKIYNITTVTYTYIYMYRNFTCTCSTNYIFQVHYGILQMMQIHRTYQNIN